MIAIIDYDAGNIKSVQKACEALSGETVKVTGDGSEILAADRVILPGVGAFGSAMERLIERGLDDVVRTVADSGRPFLGICLGLQLLFEESEESPNVAGLGVLSGRILRIPEEGGLRVPHIGWNSLTFPNEGRLFDGVGEEPFVYFVHSYYLKAEDAAIVRARTAYGVEIDASVESGNVFATQFHPEKSGKTGLAILKNFLAV
ncbi:MAG: imidazole glycerol phosphate synthase subunit HisH [Lachnospiraceae bacterium]|nr:imidazole glycerol phosphate synthase subunit HisH [Lachnospiraceae bacterium]